MSIIGVADFLPFVNREFKKYLPKSAENSGDQHSVNDNQYGTKPRNSAEEIMRNKAVVMLVRGKNPDYVYQNPYLIAAGDEILIRYRDTVHRRDMVGGSFFWRCAWLGWYILTSLLLEEVSSTLHKNKPVGDSPQALLQ